MAAQEDDEDLAASFARGRDAAGTASARKADMHDAPLLPTLALLAAATAGPAAGPDASPYESGPAPAPAGQIDRLVFARLERLGIPPANLCSDGVFVRRAYLDVTGTLPTAQEAREFILSRQSNKRAELIDRLLARKEFADYWAARWCDLLRVKAEFPINLWPNAAQAYSRWVHTAIASDMPYDRFARELLTGSGSNFRVGQVNFYRAVQNRTPQGLAQAVALTFMGARAENWPKERLDGMASFFTQVGYKSTAEWKEEIVYFDPRKGGGARAAAFPDGTAVRLTGDRDGREVLADWLIEPSNAYFARNIVNRVWSWLMGRGIIHEPDDIRPDNPPSNPELLAYLQRELVAARWDLKHIYRLVLLSTTYQLSCIARSSRPDAAANFAYRPLRRMEAEVLIDALCQITGTTESYSSLIPEPFTYIPARHRTMTLPDGSITSSFLETFGRPARDSGLESERNSRTTAAQRLHMLNSSHIQRKIEQGPRLQALLRSQRSPRDAITALYLTILSRFPTDEELKVVADYGRSATSQRETAVDVAWALINSAEFLYRH